MALSQRHLRLALWCANQELLFRRTGQRLQRPVLSWNAELVKSLELELSSSRQDESDGVSLSDHEECIGIGTVEAARILGWGIRRVQRHAADLEGRKVSGKFVFPEAAVRDYAGR